MMAMYERRENWRARMIRIWTFDWQQLLPHPEMTAILGEGRVRVEMFL
jgi:hypothetical protein